MAESSVLQNLNEDNEEEQSSSEEEQARSDDEDDGRLICDVCGKPMLHLARHLRTHGLYNCPICLLNFTTIERYNNHVKWVHERSEYVHCEVCTMMFVDSTQLTLHKYVHFKKYTCEVCGFEFKGSSKYPVINHIKLHEKNFSHKCKVCEKGFVTKSLMIAHMQSHENLSIKCRLCDKKFSLDRYRKEHEKLNHSETLFMCEVCDQTFSFKKSVVRHQTIIHGIGKDLTKKFPTCNKRLANAHNLKKHMEMHTGQKVHLCDKCGKKFAARGSLKKHQTRTCNRKKT